MGGKAALVLILGFSFVLGYISTNLSNIASRAQGNMSSYAASTVSHNLAISAANAGLAQLYQDTSWRGTVSQTLSGSMNGTATYKIANDAMGRPFLRAVSMAQGTDGLVRDTVEITFAANSYQSFSLFAWMTNTENGVYWITGDSVRGRVHSNDNMYMSGSPVFMKKLTTAKALTPAWKKSGNNAVFKEGYETGVARIDLPTDLSPLWNAATSGGRTYTGNIEVRLNGGTSASGDGYALVYSGTTRVDSLRIGAAGFNGVIASNGNVSVKGTLDGKLSIASRQNVVVLDNVVYENRNYPVTDDLLGLVAEQDVVVANNTANQSNCEIDASIFARTGSFEAESYSSGSPRGLLRVTGSLVQNARGAVGTFNSASGSLKTGYLKRYTYDERLSNPAFRPPYYPGYYAKTFAIANWWENVRIPKFY
jgi:hypothetical protein